MTESVVLVGMEPLSEQSYKIFPRLLDAFKRGRIILAPNAVHSLVDFIHTILQPLQIVSFIDGVLDHILHNSCRGASVVAISEGGCT